MGYREYGYESEREMINDVLTHEEIADDSSRNRYCPECGVRGGHSSGCPEADGDDDHED